MGTEGNEENQGQEDGDAVSDAMEEALCVTRNEVGAGGEFEREPENEDGEEVECRRLRDVAWALQGGTDHRQGRIEQYESGEGQIRRTGERGGSGEDGGAEHGRGPDAAGAAMEDVAQNLLCRAT